MTFTSLQFFGFLPIVISLYFIIPSRFRWTVLLVSSYYFYIICLAYNFFYVSILIFATIVSFFLAILIKRAGTKKKKKIFLLTGTFFFVVLLLFFKYLNFFSENLSGLFNFLRISINIHIFKFAIPLGISFYTFQIISYLIDVYNEKTEPIKHFGIYAAGVSFFPKLISGPIERSGSLFPQLYQKNEIEYSRVRDGVKLFIWGLFKKVIIADRIALVVNLVYNNPDNYYGLSILFATILLSIQIYADFSGYTDMAIGISRIFGIKLSENFDRPYLSSSISEFWRKWHITLSFWLRDYVFLPLAYSFTRKITKSKLKIKPEVFSYVAGMSITMLICGFWHGAKWTFIFWGLLHGLYLAFGFLIKKPKKRFYKKINLNKSFQKFAGIVTSFALVSFAWVFFRINSLADSGIIIKNFFKLDKSASPLKLFGNMSDLYVSLISIAFVIAIEIIQTVRKKNGKDYSVTEILNVPVVILIILSLLIFGKFEQMDFLYFSF